MPKPRRNMTARVVGLHSREAGDARVDGTVADRLDLVASLSAQLWELTGRPLPQYTRATMPAAMTTLQSGAGHD